MNHFFPIFYSNVSLLLSRLSLYPLQFISTSVRGVFSSLFCDFGPEFVVHDDNGEEPVEFFIGDITKVTGEKKNYCSHTPPTSITG